MCHSGRGSSQDRATVKPGPNTSKDQLLEAAAIFDHLGKHFAASLGLDESVSLQGDSPTTTARKVDTDIPGTTS